MLSWGFAPHFKLYQTSPTCVVGTTLGQQTHGHEQEHHLADNRQHISFVVQSLSHSGSSHCLGHVTRDDDTWSESTGGDLLQPADVHTCVPSLHSARLCKHEHRITLLYAQLKELNPFWLES